MSIRNNVYVGPYVEISSPIDLDFSELTEEHFVDVTNMLTGSVPGKKFLIPNLKYPNRDFCIDPEYHCDVPRPIEDADQIYIEIQWVVNQLKPYSDALANKYQDHPDFDPSNLNQYSGNVMWGVLVYGN